MADDACFVCFPAVRYPGGPVLRVAYAAGDSVAEENADIARGNPDATGGFLFNTWNGRFPGSVCNP